MANGVLRIYASYKKFIMNEGHHLSLQRIALDKPRASAVELVMFSTILCFTFFKIRSKVFPG